VAFRERSISMLVAVYDEEDRHYLGYVSYGDGNGSGDTGRGGSGYTTYFNSFGKPTRYDLKHCYDDGSLYSYSDRSGMGLGYALSYGQGDGRGDSVNK